MKLRGAKKAAFLNRMAKGRAKARRRNPTTQARTVVLKPATRATVAGVPAAARRPPVGAQLVYLVRGPGGQLVNRIGNPARRRRQTKKKRKQMAKLARNRKGQFLPRARRNAAVANPRLRKKSKRRAAPARAKARRRKASHHRKHTTKRRRPSVAMIVRATNPRRRRRRRNPSFGGVVATLKSSAMPMVIGGVAGLGAGYMDAKLLGSRPTVSVLAKVGLALLGAAALGGKRPLWAAGWAGGMIGSTGYHAGVRFGGGMVGLSPAGALHGIADMAANDQEMANMIAGLADVVDDNGGGALGDDAAANYNAILEEADDMADVVEVD